VTLLAGTAARSSPPRHSLGSISPKPMRRLLVSLKLPSLKLHRWLIIAPDGRVGKCLPAGRPRQRRWQEIVNLTCYVFAGAAFLTDGITVSLGQS
jgi:hypothetical protein